MSKKFFSVNTDENFTVTVFGKTVFTFYNHLIMRVNRKNFVCDFSESKLLCKALEPDVIDDMRSADFGAEFIDKFQKTNPDKCKGLALYTPDGEICAYIYGLFPECNEIQYRIRSCEFFVKYVYVYEKFRGEHLASELFRQMFSAVDKQAFTFAVRKNNLSAVKAYTRLGAEVIGKKRFIRISKIKFPYYKV